MDEVRRFCVRMLGEGPAAARAAEAAGAAPGSDRLDVLRAAVAACRSGADAAGEDAREAARDAGAERADGPDARSAGSELATAVARELRAAVAGLTPAQREAMALRDLLRLSYADMAGVLSVDPGQIAALLASARVALRDRLRGPSEPVSPCSERDRARDVIARRQDDESVSGPDEDWLIDHLGHCRACARVHAAMLEAVACYRAWPAAGKPAPATS